MSVRSKSYCGSKILHYEKITPMFNLYELTDINFSNFSDRDIITYSLPNKKWVNVINPLNQEYVKIGSNAGVNCQGIFSVAIGANAGQTNQGNHSIAIGYSANNNGNNYENTIVLNSSNGELLAEASNRTYKSNKKQRRTIRSNINSSNVI